MASAWIPLSLSLQVAAWSTAINLVLGVGVGLLLARTRFPGRELLDALLTLPMVLPPTVLGYYVLVTLGNRSAIGQLFTDLTGRTIVFSVTGCVVAATIGSLPMVVKSARAAIEGVDPTLPAAARTLGAGPVRAFFTVTLPIAAPGIVAGGMLGFARALGDFGVTLMVAGDMPGQTQTASLYIYDQIQAGHEDAAMAMSLLLTVVAVSILYAVNRITRRRGV